MKELMSTISYNNNPNYKYSTTLEPIDLDLECKLDIEYGNGFIISDTKGIKKDLKSDEGIYSSKFGQTIRDQNPFADKYRCKCGKVRSRINAGVICKLCGTVCKYVDDNFHLYGWIVLKDEYHIIHPKFYDELNKLCGNSKYNAERKKINRGGTKLENMINYSPEIDENGIAHPCEFKPNNEPYFGIGMIEFYEKFDEIIDYYVKKYPKKTDYYNDIKKYRDIVFIHSIPVFTTTLRPADVNAEYMFYEPCNSMYTMINKHVHSINRNSRKINKNITIKNSKLYKVQMKYIDLCEEITNILSGKKGQLRSLMSGRFNFTSRSVIRQDPSLRIDQVKISYFGLVIILQQRIINILIRSYNITPSEAYDIWEKSKSDIDNRIVEIINSIIHSYPEGLPLIINRNPTINYGSILQVFCIGMTKELTMSLSLQVLKLLGADFDGDTLNELVIINKDFFTRAYYIFNPRNAMQISRVDGKLNSAIIVQRDTLINADTLMRIGRHKYNKSQLDKINKIKESQKVVFGLDI